MTSKKFVSIIAGVLILCSVVTKIIVYILQTGDVNMLFQSIRFVLTCLLAYSLIRGSNLGRWFSIIFAGYNSVIYVVVSFIAGIALMTKSIEEINVTTQLIVAIIGLLLGIAYGACVIGLLTPIARKHFAQKGDLTIEKRRIFKVPLAGWILLGIWLVINLVAIFIVSREVDTQVSGYVLGRFIGIIITPFILAWILTVPIWLAGHRSQKVASISFVVFCCFFILGLTFQNIPR